MNKVNKNIKTLEIIFLVLLLGFIISMMTIFKGNSVKHNEIIGSGLLALFAYVLYKFLFLIRKEKYFALVLILNVVGFLFIIFQTYSPKDRNDFSGLYQAMGVASVLFLMIIINSVIFAIHSSRK